MALVASSAEASTGEKVSVKRAGVQSTAALNLSSELRPKLRLQPPQEDEELDREALRGNPKSPASSDGQSRTSASAAAYTAFGATPALGFDGPGFVDAMAFPPDPQGDVGPTQYIAFVNGRLRSYSKSSGTADGVLNADPNTWWASAMTPVGGAVTSNRTTDPRIRYDRLTDRWFAVMIDLPNEMTANNRVMIAVSSAGVITASTTWTFYYLEPSAGEFTDYPTLGVDQDALYIGTNQFSTSGDRPFIGSDGYVVRKAAITGGSGGPASGAATKFDLVSYAGAPGPYTPQGVDNAGSNGGVGYFIGVANTLSGTLVVRRVSSPGSGSPTISGDLNVTVPATARAVPGPVPTAGGIALDTLDDRLFSAQMRGSSIWTAHHIGVNRFGQAQYGGRAASRWYQVNTNGPGGTPSRVQSGTVFDPAASNPRSYWFPSVAVNGQGAMVIGGSTAGSTAYVDAWYSGRLASYSAGVTDEPTRYTNSSSAYNALTSRWGDYSTTRVDPVDDQTIWTIQQYVSAPDVYGTRIAKLMAPPPAKPVSTSAVAPIGQASTNVTLNGESTAGSSFFDPGPGFASRLAVIEGCSGVTVNSVSDISPTRLVLDLDTRGAAEESCGVTVTNPDGQSQSSATSILRVGASPGGGEPGGGAPGGQAPGGSPPNDSGSSDPATPSIPSAPSSPSGSGGGGPSGSIAAPSASWKVVGRRVTVAVKGAPGLRYSVTARRGTRRVGGACKSGVSGPVRCSVSLGKGRWAVSVVGRDSSGRLSAPTSRSVRIR